MITMLSAARRGWCSAALILRGFIRRPVVALAERPGVPVVGEDEVGDLVGEVNRGSGPRG
jgi:hypothetical protein